MVIRTNLVFSEQRRQSKQKFRTPQSALLMHFYFVSGTKCYNVTRSNKTVIWMFDGLSYSIISCLRSPVCFASSHRLNNKVSRNYSCTVSQGCDQY